MQVLFDEEMKPCSTVLSCVLLCVLNGGGTTQYAIHKRLDRASCSTISRAIYALEIVPLVMREGGEKMVEVRTQEASQEASQEAYARAEVNVT
jgi:hypothetical protein